MKNFWSSNEGKKSLANEEENLKYNNLISSNIDGFINMLDGAEIDFNSLNMQQKTIVNKYRAKLTRKSTIQTIKNLWRYMKLYKLNLITVLLVTLFGVAFNSLAAFASIYLTNLLGVVQNYGEINQTSQIVANAKFPSLVGVTLVILLFYFLYSFATWLQNRIMVIVSQKVGYKIREDLFDKIQKLPVKYFDQHSSGDLLSRFTNDVNNITDMFSQNSAIILNGIALIFTMTLSMFLLSPYMALIVLSLSCLLLIPMLFVSRKSQPLFNKMQKTLGQVNGYIEEMISGQTIVSLYDQNKNVVKKFEKINDQLVHVSRKGQEITSFIMPYLVMCLNVITTVVWTIGVLFTIKGVGSGFKGITMIDIFGINSRDLSSLPPSLLPIVQRQMEIVSGISLTASFAIMSRTFFLPFTQVGGIANQFLMALAGGDRVFQVFKEKNEFNDIERLILNVVDTLHDGERFPSTEDTQRVSIINENGKLEKLSDVAHTIETNSSLIVKDLNFGYLPNKQILFDVNIDVKKGQTIAIVGPTGSGKSTFINLLTKFYDIDDGDILFGKNVSIKRITKESMRNNVSIVLQDTFLFNESIKDNIRYGNMNATDEEIIKAAKTANAHNFIMQLPNGYDTVLKDNGEDLSQGQRQLLAIARALLAPSNILILDEATSSIDTKTEVEIQTAMLRLMENKTSFVIAHRLSTIQNADQILVLKDGRIIERGTHQELIDKKGFYYDLHNSQFYEE
ncbi:MAG: ABC transporter ATP-binding protein/permease [Ureaplasma sp.]|nr:ABC transporter ATP-binding protein/permease [Ureaplasma sp.]MDE7222000.1 ABC transporter ATP-binding protein/permease [Ureaplasma sp.]